jgi:nucleotide-binding universal stress UspA family protein
MPAVKIDDLMFATDFSAASERAGVFARELAAQMGARLHIVHVACPPTGAPDAAQRIARLAKVADGTLHVEIAVLSGRAVPELIRYARQRRVGLMVVGTHGRTGWSRALLGSVAEGIMRLAPCPVLTVPDASVNVDGAALESGRTAPHRCVVCGNSTDAFVCETCGTRLRAQALEQTTRAEAVK